MSQARAMRLARRSAKRLFHPVALAAALLASAPAGATDYAFVNGYLSSSGLPSAITINDTLSIGCAAGYSCGTTYADSNFRNDGTVNATQSLNFLYASNVWTNGWQYRMDGDVGLVNAAYGGLFINDSSGGLVKTSGTGTSTISISTQSRSGSILDAMTGTIAFTAASASFDSGAILLAASGAGIAFTGGSASFADGVRFLGDGHYNIGTSASFGGAVGAQHLTFSNGTYTGGDGSAGSGATLTSDASWIGTGYLAGGWTVAAGSTLRAQGAGTRYLYGAVTNLGTLNTDTPLYLLYSSHVLDNQGTLNLQGDVGLSNAAYGGAVVNSGTLAKTTGTGAGYVAGLNFTNNGGRIDVQSGSLQFSGNLAFNDGTRFTGAGVAQVVSGATFTGHIASANLLLGSNSSTYTGGDGSASGLTSQATLHGSTRFGGGYLAGQWLLAADHTLTVEAGANKYLYGSLTNQGVINAADNLYFVYGSHVLDNQGTLKLQADITLANAAYGGRLLSSGLLAKTAGSGTATISGLNNTLGGVVDVQAGTLLFANGSTSVQSGAVLRAAAGTALQFAGGQTTLAAGVTLQGEGQFGLSGNTTVLGAIGASHLSLGSGEFTGGDGSAGSAATLSSDAVWSGTGYLRGSWTLATGKTLQALGAGNRYLYGSLTNLGTLNTDAPLYFEYASHALDNQGTLQLQGDVGLANLAYGGTVTNSGTLAKIAGTGVSSISGLNFSNNGGLIDVQTGALQFSGGSLRFNDGTRFTGAGVAQVLSDATFTGHIAASRLVLGNATYSGGDGSASGPASVATLHGNTSFTGGYLAGQWQLAADHRLQVEAGSTKYIFGSVTNQGLINAADNLSFVYGSHLLDNRGTLNLQGDVGLVNVAYGGTVLNSGRLAKTAGTGESSLASISLTNTGTIAVQTGTLRLPTSFTNDGVLMGTGTLAAGQITNLGLIAAGASLVSSSGTLTLASHLVQGSSARLQIGLLDAANHGLLVVHGNATLDGTLALQCEGACSFAAGTDIRVLDATGSLSGRFANLTLAGFGGGAFEVVYDAANSDVFLHVTQDVLAAVPEPETYALWLVGLGAMGLLMRRRPGR